jgi:hypothetical protein
MNSLLLSSAYLPRIHYFGDILNAQKIWIEACETYSRQTARNHCVIYGPNGIQRLSIPVVHPESGEKDIRSIRIDHSRAWQKLHWRSLETAYNRSPFFLYYRDELEQMYLSRETFLFDLNCKLLELCLKWLKLGRDYSLTSEYVANFTEGTDRREPAKGQKQSTPQPYTRYPQVFEPIHGFIPDLSIIDLLFNRGNDALDYLRKINGNII